VTIPKIKKTTEFCNEFVNEYLAGGLGRLQKRDVDILVLHLLLKDKRYVFPDDMFKACRDLRLTETRIRNLYQEVQLRYNQLEDNDARLMFVHIIKTNSYKISGSRVTFIVRDPMMGQFFEEWVAAENGFTDSSFNKNLVTIEKSVLEKVIARLAVSNIGTFPEEAEILNDVPNRKTLFRIFAEEFMKSAGSEAGALTAKGAAAALALMLGVAV
jgi:hypothetical protein